MAQPRPWPNNAKEARDRAAEELCKVIFNLEPMLTDPLMTDDDLIRRVAIALNSAQLGLRFLESVGAQTKPL